MPTTNLLVTGDVSYSLWLYGAGTAWQCLQNYDYDTIFVYSLDQFQRTAVMTHQQLPGTASSINACVNYALARVYTVDGALGIFDGVSYINKGALTGAYAWYSQSHNATHMTVAYVNSDYIGIWLDSSTGQARCEQTYRYVDYAEGGMYFVPIWMLLPGVFGGAGLLFRELQEMVKLVARKGIIYRDWEVKKAWREYKNGLVLPKYLDLKAA